jgi:PAS domain S-box-containing protein
MYDAYEGAPMEDKDRLNDAFLNFAQVSRSLEEVYKKLQEKVQYMTIELKEKNEQLEEALGDTQEAKDYLKGVLESLREAIIVLDAEGRISMFNPAAQSLLGISARDALLKPFTSLDVRIETQGPDTTLYAGGKRYDVFLSRSGVMDAQGALRAEVILLQDISRMKELETLQERNKRLIAMGEMAAQIVHEIRSPLCSIELYATMLEKDLDGTKHVDMARGISTGIRSLNNILTNMLFFAKPQKPLLGPVNPGEVLDETLYMLAPLIESRGVEILKADRHIDARVDGDAELIKQVYMNVIINALQASSEGSTVAIQERLDDGNFVVAITDCGEGIASQNIERIFDPFFSTKEKGTGLGLAITSKIMIAHGGTIKVKSEPGKGSVFSLYFPIKEEPC